MVKWRPVVVSKLGSFLTHGLVFQNSETNWFIHQAIFYMIPMAVSCSLHDFRVATVSQLPRANSL